MAPVVGSVAAVNDFLESDEDDDLEDITTCPAILSFFNIHLLTDQNDFWKKLSSLFSLTLRQFSKQLFQMTTHEVIKGIANHFFYILAVNWLLKIHISVNKNGYFMSKKTLTAVVFHVPAQFFSGNPGFFPIAHQL